MFKAQITQSQKILILAAIPHGLRLDKEIREIEGAIRRANKRDFLEIRTRTAVRPDDIRRAIAEEKPQIVHFCGHGLEDGSLLLEDDGGQDKTILPEALASLFKLHADYVDCVLLNACHSVKSAEAISEYINYAIGMNQQIQDKSAIQFSQGFYDGLGYETQNHNDVFQRAFDEGIVAIKLEYLSQGNIPVLKRKASANIKVDKSYKLMNSNIIPPKEIASLAFSRILEKSEDKYTEDALAKIDELKQIIGEKFQGNSRAEKAFTAVEQGSKDYLDRVVTYLNEEMDEDPQFASQIQALAQEIKAGKKQDNRANIQNNYDNAKGLLATGGTNYQAENMTFN
ncbi:CHAT domain-containing protein [Rivularia sp. UHCC 0363]|uniref:CHAT domain-containing protein n=1 Tax=Rivularia sp. UHCC 0363 TaxID=3110244 RepID=UPI002B1FA698|nr:CHAT domain-containing protein [Rivularia sp. UHCC 0363]MEA5592839.1 CHAT domain-containing protein [Rivularia sp. UHCC 0363]